MGGQDWQQALEIPQAWSAAGSSVGRGVAMPQPEGLAFMPPDTGWGPAQRVVALCGSQEACDGPGREGCRQTAAAGPPGVCPAFSNPPTASQ